MASNAAGGGFLAGLNDVLMLGGLLSIAGAVLALWLVREREIERRPTKAEGRSEPEALSKAA
jgi:hypothetical protein